MSSSTETVKLHNPKGKTRKRRRFLVGRKHRAHAEPQEKGHPLLVRSPKRPTHRSECKNGPRPCPWVGCRYHLYLDVYTTGDPENPTPGLIIHHPEVEPLELPETCLLDLVERGPYTLAEIGDVFDLSRERIRQIETNALRKLSRGQGVSDVEEVRKLLEHI
jgi:hypothetical protein